jgi:uncharacterized protein
MNKVKEFVGNIEKMASEISLDISGYEMDHVCYRVESQEEYDEWKVRLTEIGNLLVEDEINGRLICTFKLFDPVIVGKRLVRMIELPMPKPSVFYPSGWEHAEFVVGQEVDLRKFAGQYPELNWDFTGIQKSLNPDIRLELSTNPPISIKFHHLPLDKVIEIEKRKRTKSLTN